MSIQPRLHTVNMLRRRALEDIYFLVVIDLANVYVLPYVGLIVTSLSEYFDSYATAPDGR